MNNTTPWLIDERKPMSPVHLDQLDRELVDIGRGGEHGAMSLAVLLHDVVIHDTKKWFGEANIRLDAMVITGHRQTELEYGFYMPKTLSFVRVSDHDMLPIGDGGLLLFYGPALHFIDIVLLVSRDRKDTQNLAELLTRELSSSGLQGAVGSLLSLGAAPPTVAAVTGAMGAAAALGDAAYRLLQAATGATIGAYRVSYLQIRDGFGIGPHPGPRTQRFRVKDLSFRYEIVHADPIR